MERRPTVGRHLERGGTTAVSRARSQATTDNNTPIDRKLLAAGLRDPVRTIDGLLPDPDLHTLRVDRHNIVGELLAKPKRDPRSGGPRSNHCAHYDDPNVLDERGATKDLLRQVHRRLSGHLLRHGLCLVAR
ncbi:ionotropic GABA-aminobutyric acid receptor RDL3 isoform X10 [Vespula maculifrons]|uniref:Ionotropic GABA-aminobutyric acid receptor RDL3 isoform X10 n=1 Tax=Vespula maculifrons TaxID=7453 RepID=A0ABD2CZY2_VESMC